MNITREELDRLYNQERLTMREIAQRLEVSLQTIRNWMDRVDLPRRDNSESHRAPLDDGEIERLYLIERLTIGVIATRLGVGNATIWRRLKKRSVPRRSVCASPFLPLDDGEIERLYVVEQLALSEIAQRLQVDKMTIRSHLVRRGVALRSISEANMRYPRLDFSGDPLEKAYLTGFRLGDLHVEMKSEGTNCATIVVSCGTTRAEQISLFRELFSPYGHVRVSPPSKDVCNRSDLACWLNLSFDFLLPKQDAIPDWILGSAQSSGDMRPFLAFLAGYTDAEGCFCVLADGKAWLRLASYDVNILRQIHAVLNQQLGVRCPPLYLTKPKGYLNSGGHRTNQDCWLLSVYRKSSLNRLCELLEPYLKHSKRQADMRAVWANVRARGVD